jgi:hypothetical protein
MGQQRDHGGKDAKRDMPGEVGASKSKYRCGDETDQSETNRGEKGLSQRCSEYV